MKLYISLCVTLQCTYKLCTRVCIWVIPTVKHSGSQLQTFNTQLKYYLIKMFFNVQKWILMNYATTKDSPIILYISFINYYIL